jgi:lipoate-protein ligase A
MAPDEWRLLDISYQSPYRNLALEEALLRSSKSENFMRTVRIWANSATTVVGRFQDVSMEVDLQLCSRNGVQIVRRFTGGGTVYHDEGNLNITILNKRECTGLETVQRINMSIIRRTLSKLGVESIIDPPNSLLVDGEKVAGSAAAVNREFILWHASLLISTDLEMLEQILSPSKKHVPTIHVRSNWHPTTSLQKFLHKPLQVSDVRTRFLESMQDMLGAELTSSSLSSQEKGVLQKLYDYKYSKNYWNFDGQDVPSLTQTTIAV